MAFYSQNKLIERNNASILLDAVNKIACGAKPSLVLDLSISCGRMSWLGEFADRISPQDSNRGVFVSFRVDLRLGVRINVPVSA
jgi:hypothetical protein